MASRSTLAHPPELRLPEERHRVVVISKKPPLQSKTRWTRARAASECATSPATRSPQSSKCAKISRTAIIVTSSDLEKFHRLRRPTSQGATTSLPKSSVTSRCPMNFHRRAFSSRRKFNRLAHNHHSLTTCKNIYFRKQQIGSLVFCKQTPPNNRFLCSASFIFCVTCNYLCLLYSIIAA